MATGGDRQKVVAVSNGPFLEEDLGQGGGEGGLGGRCEDSEMAA